MEVRASTIALLLSRKWVSPGCSVHHGKLGLVLTSHTAFCVLIAARPSAYICRVIDPCCRSAVSSFMESRKGHNSVLLFYL